MHSAGGLVVGITNRSRLGRGVKRIRKAQQLTQTQVAEAAGVSLLCLRDLETANRSVGSENVIKILRALGYELALRPKMENPAQAASCMQPSTGAVDT